MTFAEAITYVSANQETLIAKLSNTNYDRLHNEDYLSLMRTFSRAIMCVPEDPQAKLVTVFSVLSAAVDVGVAIGQAMGEETPVEKAN